MPNSSGLPPANLQAFDVNWAAFSDFWYEAAAEASAHTDSVTVTWKADSSPLIDYALHESFPRCFPELHFLNRSG